MNPIPPARFTPRRYPAVPGNRVCPIRTCSDADEPMRCDRTQSSCRMCRDCVTRAPRAFSEAWVSELRQRMRPPPSTDTATSAWTPPAWHTRARYATRPGKVHQIRQDGTSVLIITLRARWCVTVASHASHASNPPPAKAISRPIGLAETWVARRVIWVYNSKQVFLMLNTVTAPDHLSVRSQAVWRSTLQTHELREDELSLLEEALTQLDRAASARRQLNESGLMIAGLHGPRLSPLLAVERHASAAGARLLRQLGLTDGEGDRVGA